MQQLPAHDQATMVNPRHLLGPNQQATGTGSVPRTRVTS